MGIAVLFKKQTNNNYIFETVGDADTKDCYKGLWSGIQDVVQCRVTAVIPFQYNKLY